MEGQAEGQGAAGSWQACSRARGPLPRHSNCPWSAICPAVGAADHTLVSIGIPSGHTLPLPVRLPSCLSMLLLTLTVTTQCSTRIPVK